MVAIATSHPLTSLWVPFSLQWYADSAYGGNEKGTGLDAG
jgi:hypothetical protein